MKKSTTIITILASFCFFMLLILIVGAYQEANTVHNFIDANSVEIKYYTTTQEIHITKNDEAGTELTFTNLNRTSFGILKGWLLKEGFAFDHRPTPAENAHWRGMRIKKRPPATKQTRTPGQLPKNLIVP